MLQGKKLYEKLLFGFKRACNKNNELWKQRNNTVNKWRKKYTAGKKNIRYVKKRFCTDDDDNKKHHEVRYHCHYIGKYRGAAHDICNLRYKTPKETLVVFHKGSTCGYYFIMKKLAKVFEGQFEYLGENAEKYIMFSVTIKKELDNDKTSTYKLKIVDSFRYMSSSLSNLADNLFEIYGNEWKRCQENKISPKCALKGFKNNRLSYTCECRKQ